jgi:propionyl-CoA carboxylase alpha chain
VFVDSALGSVRLKALPRFTEPADEVAPGSLLAPMPGTIARTAIQVGDSVAKGQPLLWLEAMKMEHPVLAPADGVVAELPVGVGQQVDVGSVLAVVRPEEES